MDEVSVKKLAADCRMVIADAQEVFKIWGAQARQRIGQLRRQAGENPESLPAQDRAVLAAEESLQERWTPVALAAGVGVIAGLMIRPMLKRMG